LISNASAVSKANKLVVEVNCRSILSASGVQDDLLASTVCFNKKASFSIKPGDEGDTNSGIHIVLD
jgi:hypothetical protein